MDDNKKDKKDKNFYIVPQTEGKIERNRKIMEMRSGVLLEKYEKTFQFLPGGSVIKVEENKEK